MSPRTMVRIGIAATALAFAGCAAEAPVNGAVADPPCDLLCRFMRLLNVGEPPPVPVVLPPKPPSRPKAPHATLAKAARRRPPPPLRPTLPTPVIATEPLPVEPLRPAPMPARAAAPGEPAVGIMPGSPGITPPWFEPWSETRVP